MDNNNTNLEQSSEDTNIVEHTIECDNVQPETVTIEDNTTELKEEESSNVQEETTITHVQNNTTETISSISEHDKLIVLDEIYAMYIVLEDEGAPQYEIIEELKFSLSQKNYSETLRNELITEFLENNGIFISTDSLTNTNTTNNIFTSQFIQNPHFNIINQQAQQAQQAPEEYVSSDEESDSDEEQVIPQTNPFNFILQLSNFS